MASNIDRSLASTFGLPVEEEEKSIPVIREEQPDKDDISFVRSKLHDLLSDGADAFTKLADIATDSEKPSAFVALNDMMKTLSDISMKLVELEEKKQKLKAPSADNQTTQITNNNTVYVGSTADLAKLFSQANIGETIDVETKEAPSNN